MYTAVLYDTYFCYRGGSLGPLAAAADGGGAGGRYGGDGAHGIHAEPGKHST